MSLGSLPTLPAKPRLTAGLDLYEIGQGDPTHALLCPDDDLTLSKTHGFPDDDDLTLSKTHGLPDKEKKEKGILDEIFLDKEEKRRPSKVVDVDQFEFSTTPRTLEDRGVTGDLSTAARATGRETSILHRQASCKTNKFHQDVDEAMYNLPITRAIIRGEHSLVLESLRQGENPNSVCSKTGQSYLHIISRQASSDKETAWVPMVYQLSNAGADLSLRDRDGCTATLVAIRRKLIQVMAALLKCGAELGLAEHEEAESVRGMIRNDMMEIVRRFSPGYWGAVLDPNPFKVSRLVKAWARINICWRGQGQTLIEFAKQNAKDAAVVRLLLQHEVSIELAHAVMAGDSHRARVLLCDGAADLGTADFSVRSAALNSFAPLSLTGAAEKYGHVKVLKLLQAREAGGLKSPSASPVRDPGITWPNGESCAKSSPGAVYQGRSGDKQMATNPPTSAMCTIL